MTQAKYVISLNAGSIILGYLLGTYRSGLVQILKELREDIRFNDIVTFDQNLSKGQGQRLNC